MLKSTGISQIIKVAAPLLLFLWSLSYFNSYSTAYYTVLRNLKDQKSVFITDFLSHEIDGGFDGGGISELCASRTWTPNLYLSCDPPAGGIGQVKNNHLLCIRLAIEMGAELILPEIIKRHDTDITRTTPNGGSGPIKSIPLDYFFEAGHLTQTLSTLCPQMKLHRSLNDLYDIPSLLTPVTFSLDDLGAPRNNGVISDLQGLPKNIQDFVNLKWPREKRPTPIRFNFARTAFAWPTAADKPAVSRNFGRILLMREDARRLAASALFEMQRQFHLSLDPRYGIKRETFVGVHLRTELDVDNLYPAYDVQAAHYLDYVTKSRIPLIFLATGATHENITAFAQRAKDFNVTVVMKKDILGGDDLDLLNRLTWDQRAMVDYEIMLRAGLVAGPSESSFTWNLAMRRRNIYGGSGALEQPHSALNIQWQDKYTTVFGRSERGQAMMQTIWP